MKLRLITVFIIISNILLLMHEIPNNIILLSIAGLIGSFAIKGKKTRITIKVVLLIASMIMLRQDFRVLLVTECGVSFVLLLSALKFWELDDERDHFNMFLILALSECCIFLLNPTFFIFFFGILKMLFYFYYILKIRNYDIALLNPKRLLILTAPSLVLSLILFYTFPRFTQGFINTSDMQYIISGGNSKIDFKQLGPLSQSTEVAFKAYGLENSQLPFKLLYWKSAVLWELSKEEWSASNSNLRQNAGPLPGARLKYEVEVFQAYKEYMPTLDGSSVVMNSSQNFTSFADGSFRLKAISRTNLSYGVAGTYGERNKTMSPLMEKKGLKIRSPKIPEIKKLYFSRATNSPSDQVRLKELIQIFKGRLFEYNISPPPYSSVEDFLLSGKAGYCSHFASAFTYLARLYNLPARMVVGYLGGEFNPYDNSVLVKELDAHAWVEVFIQEKGWVKVDPTALVVPARIQMSAEEFNNALNPYITIFNYKISRDMFTFSSLNNVSLWLDSMNSRFSSNIFNFDREKQLAVLRSLTPGKLSVGWIFTLSLCSFLIIFWLIFHYYGKKRMNPAEKRYRKFLIKMHNQGFLKDPHETISQFRSRILRALPHEVNYINSEVSHYINSFYK